MDAGEPRARHRGFFLHSDTTGEADHTVEQENPEGFRIRVSIRRPTVPRRGASGTRTARLSGDRSRVRATLNESTPHIRSGSVTGSRQRAHLPR